LLYGTSSSSENEHKKVSPDRNSNSEKSPHRSPKHLQEEDSGKNHKKMSPSLREKRVSFESKEEKKEEVVIVVEKEREDSLPPPDFEENYLIAQSDILRQASIEYDRRMHEHKELLQRMRQDEHFDESTSQEFPDFETWMEEREKEESRKSSLENKTEEASEKRGSLSSKPYPMANLREQVLTEVSIEGSFDSVDKQSEDEPPQQLIVIVDMEPPPKDNEDSKISPVEQAQHVDLAAVLEMEADMENMKQQNEKNYKEVLHRIQNLVLVEYLRQTESSLKYDDLKGQLVKQDSLKEMRRSLERREGAPRVERRRRSEEKSPVTGKNRDAKQRRSLSFDEEILI